MIMTLPRLLVGTTVLNLALLIFTLAQTHLALAEAAPAVWRESASCG
jgi:hypothetical protein